MSSVLAEIFPFDCQNFNIFFSALSHNSVIYGLNFMKPILNIYDHSEAMHMKFYLNVISYGKLLPFHCLNLNDTFHPQP